MKLIVGLGNVGQKYQKTRHNIGFEVVDHLAGKLGDTKFQQHAKAPAYIANLKAEKNVILAKPTTMMNLSGQAVQALVQYYKINLDDVWIVHDELDLRFGQMRIRKGGGSAGNNGIKSIIQHLGAEFWRVRIGIANVHLPVTPSDQFVLDNFSGTEAQLIPKVIEQAASYLAESMESGELIDHTQNLI